jgi:hypothetical protein
VSDLASSSAIYRIMLAPLGIEESRLSDPDGHNVEAVH